MDDCRTLQFGGWLVVNAPRLGVCGIWWSDTSSLHLSCFKSRCFMRFQSSWKPNDLFMMTWDMMRHDITDFGKERQYTYFCSRCNLFFSKLDLQKVQSISRTFGGWCNISVNFVKDPSADQLTGSAVFSIQKLQVPDSSSRFEIKRIPPQKKGPPKKARINLAEKNIKIQGDDVLGKLAAATLFFKQSWRWKWLICRLNPSSKAPFSTSIFMGGRSISWANYSAKNRRLVTLNGGEE